MPSHLLAMASSSCSRLASSPGPIFILKLAGTKNIVPANLNIKIGPGDEASSRYTCSYKKLLVMLLISIRARAQATN